MELEESTSSTCNQYCSMCLKYKLNKMGKARKIGALSGFLLIVTIPMMFDSLFRNILVHGKHIDRWSEMLWRKTFRLNIDNDYTKPFAYYIIAEECLDDSYLKDDVIGDGRDRDVYVMSYKHQCKQTVSHVTYLFDLDIPWLDGRNKLHQYVQTTQNRYNYHLFLDEQVWIKYANGIKTLALDTNTVVSMNNNEILQTLLMTTTIGNLSTWRYLERILLAYSPGVAVVNTINTNSRTLQEKQWKTLCDSKAELPPVTSTFFIETSFIAYHDEAIALMMPHPVSSINTSKYLSMAYLINRAKTILYRQCIAIWSLDAVVNTEEHFNYSHLNTYMNIIRSSEEKNTLDISNGNGKKYSTTDKEESQWKDILFSDRAVCDTPIKFPIKNHYQMQLVH